MKKILLGFLIIAGLSACSSTKEKEMDIPTQVQRLNEDVSTQTKEYEELKTETEGLRMRIDELNELINESNN